MSEFVTIQVGQCGNQIGSAFWPLVLEEHGITSNVKSISTEVRHKLREAFHSFFWSPSNSSASFQSLYDLRKEKVKARAVLIDMEESVVSRFHEGPLSSLFDKTCFLTNHPGSGNNWAVGHYMHANEHKEALSDMLRRTSERCDSLHGFLVLFSLGGGTGSGLGTAVVKLLEDQFPLVDRLVTCVHPGEYNDVVTSPYNVALSLRLLTEHATCVFPVDNKALTDICARQRINREVEGWVPYKDMNSIIVKMLLNLTSGSRFPGPLNLDMSELAPNLVPYSGLHYLTASLSPLDLCPDKDIAVNLRRQRELMSEICSRDNHLVKVSALRGTVLSAALLCRGDISLSTCREYVARLQKKAKFVEWNHSGVKTGLCSVPCRNYPSSLLSLINSTSMSSFFTDSMKHFNMLYNRKAHIHHYTKIDGFEADEFEQTKNSILNIIELYEQAGQYIQVPRLQVI